MVEGGGQEVGEEDLRGMQLVGPEAALVGFHQAHLAHRGGGLEFIEGAGPLAPAQALDTLGDGAAADQDDFLPHAGNLGDLLGPEGQAGVIQAPTLVGDQAATHLDHQAARLRDH